MSPAATGDFTVSANKTLTIAAGATESTGTVTITAVDNDVDAANKTVTVSATADRRRGVRPSAATLTITDDDTRGVTVTGGSLTMDEADKAGTQDTREDQGSYTGGARQRADGRRAHRHHRAGHGDAEPDKPHLHPVELERCADGDGDGGGRHHRQRWRCARGNITHAVVAGDSDYAGVAAASVAVTVNDDDGTPSVTLELSSASITENGGSSTVTAS